MKNKKMREIIDFISQKKFSQIPENAFFKIEPKEGNILFVDGGNAELISTPNFSLNFIRTAGVVFNGKEKTKISVAEFYVLFYLERKEDKIIVNTKIIPVKGDLNLDEKEFIFYFMQQEFSFFSDIVRRISEINLASQMAKSLGSKTLIVLDGTLEAKSEIEKSAIEKLRNFARVNAINLCALSKTTSALSYNGESLAFLILKSAPKERCYAQLADYENIKTFFLKLHPKSSYIFRCDLFPETSSEIFSNLAFISNDAVFLGYPYGLIEADKIARVSNREKEILRVEFAARAGKKWADFEEMEKSLNAHKILDSIL